MRTIKDYIMLAVRGVGMGAADAIPGVSGGTIAFMTGIFEELVASINSINTQAMRLLLSGNIKGFWQHINGNFLVSIGIGILFSVATLAKLMLYLLSHHPIETWGFFFGLIVASSIFILKEINKWTPLSLLMVVFGIFLGVVVCTLSPTETPDDLWFIFLSGAIAICAMILPGISGSFILLILGKYEYIMSVISGLTSGDIKGNLPIIAIFGLGALTGIISFSKFLHWLLRRFHRETLLVMAGFIIGSLVKVWPWSNMDAIKQSQFPDVPQELLATIPTERVDMHYVSAVIFAMTGLLLVSGIEMLSKAIAKRKQS
ncbi:MAG: DUF368 domain-containing protein [Bacteroides sp.]|nr:DUF368 domain-containing protein [Bacteroides sp.]MCM1447003.1 DUF368 domain-containing protein [Bacteroides sp.]